MRQHVTTVIGKAEEHAPQLRRRATDRLGAPRALVYVEEFVEVIAEGPDGVLLDAPRARELAGALLNAADTLDGLELSSVATGPLEVLGNALIAGAPQQDRAPNSANPAQLVDALEAAGYRIVRA